MAIPSLAAARRLQPSDTQALAPVVVLVPEPAQIDPALAYYTDYEANRAEFGRALDALGRPWVWQPVRPNTIDHVLDAVAATSLATRSLAPTFVNLCDGDGSNDVPGLDVIEALEARGLRYTGADAPFYRLTTSKRPMKVAFAAHGVSTPEWHAWQPDDDAATVLARVGTPAIVKPCVSAGSIGLSVRSVIDAPSDLLARLDALTHGYHGWNLLGDGVLVERYIAGREFTTLVMGRADAPHRLCCLPPAERVFHQALPATERFLSYDRLWEVYEEESPLPDGGYLWEYAPVEGALTEAIDTLSRAAYTAVGGYGYGRVDIRQDAATGALYVLEVNAQCGLSESEDYTSVGAILRYAGWSFTDLVARLLADAEEA